MTKEELAGAIASLDSAILPFESWGRIIDNWVLICAAIVAAALAAEVVFSVMHWKNERSLRPMRAELSRLHAVELETMQKETATANNAAAQANERAAEIMKATAWRQFTPDQTNKLTAALSNQTGKYVAAWIANDPEWFGLAFQFVNLLHSFSGKWDMVNSAKVYPANLVWGIVIPDVVGAEETVQVFRNAFTQAGITFSTNPLPPESMSYGPSDASVFAGRAIVFFGSRLPTFSQQPN